MCHCATVFHFVCRETKTIAIYAAVQLEVLAVRPTVYQLSNYDIRRHSKCSCPGLCLEENNHREVERLHFNFEAAMLIVKLLVFKFLFSCYHTQR